MVEGPAWRPPPFADPVQAGGLRHAVRDQIEEHIRTARLGAGDAMPSEVTLARVLGVSRVTLREALRDLENDGVVVRRQGVGTFVAPPRPVLECALTQNLGVTEMIERSGLVAGTAGLWVYTRVQDHQAAEALGTRTSHLAAVERVRTADGRPIVATTDIFDRELLSAELLQDFRGSIYELVERHARVRVIRGRARLSPAKATRRIGQLLHIPTDSLVLLLEQTDFDDGDRPVLFSREFWVKDTIEFLVDRSR